MLIYGCDVASNEAGRSLLTLLGNMTGLDVAASVDDTGHASFGGDWELEFTTGNIEAAGAISSDGQRAWAGLLAFETYRDEFTADSYSNSQGTQDWTTSPWVEIGESNGPNSGQTQVTNFLGEQGLQVWQDARGAVRQLDLSNTSSAFLSFNFAREGLDGASDYIVLELSDGDGGWLELDRWAGPANDTEMQFAAYDISELVTGNTQIRFLTSGLNATESIFVDNFQVAFAIKDLSIQGENLVNDPEPPAPVDIQQTSSERRGSQHAVALAADGSYVVVWTEGDPAFFNRDVYARRFDATGGPLTGEILVNENAAGNDQSWASVVSDAAGNFVVTWTSNQAGDDVYMRTFAANGGATSGEVRVNTTTFGEQDNSAIAMDGDGNFVVVWEGNGPGDTFGIFAQRFSPVGAPVDGEFRVNTDTFGTQRDAAVSHGRSRKLRDCVGLRPRIPFPAIRQRRSGAGRTNDRCIRYQRRQWSRCYSRRWVAGSHLARWVTGARCLGTSL